MSDAVASIYLAEANVLLLTYTDSDGNDFDVVAPLECEIARVFLV